MLKKKDLRKEQVLLLLNEREHLSVSNISKRFNVSPATARRLCNELAEEGLVIRSHGFIEKPDAPDISGYDLSKARGESFPEKRRIAQYVAGLMRDGNNIFLESGSTTLEVAASIAERLRRGELQTLHVFTDFLPILDILGNYCEVSVLGGVYNPAKRIIRGYMSEVTLDRIHFDYCILGCEAISLEGGLMIYDQDGIRFFDSLMKHTKKTVVVAHSRKFHRQSLYSLTPCERLSLIVTDVSLEDNILNEFTDAGIPIIRV